MIQFKIGMRIKAIGDFNGNRLQGLCGTIMHIHDGTNLLCVAWDEKIRDGHTCSGRCEQGYGCDIEQKNAAPLTDYLEQWEDAK